MADESDHHLHDKIIRIKARVALLFCLGQMGAHAHEVRAQQTYKPTAELIGLSETEQLITIYEKNGVGEDRPWWPNVVQWARQRLKELGALAPSRHGYWRLSDKGQKMYENQVARFEDMGVGFEEFIEASVKARREN